MVDIQFKLPDPCMFVRSEHFSLSIAFNAVLTSSGGNDSNTSATKRPKLYEVLSFPE